MMRDPIKELCLKIDVDNTSGMFFNLNEAMNYKRSDLIKEALMVRAKAILTYPLENDVSVTKKAEFNDYYHEIMDSAPPKIEVNSSHFLFKELWASFTIFSHISQSNERFRAANLHLFATQYTEKNQRDFDSAYTALTSYFPTYFRESDSLEENCLSLCSECYTIVKDNLRLMLTASTSTIEICIFFCQLANLKLQERAPSLICTESKSKSDLLKKLLSGLIEECPHINELSNEKKELFLSKYLLFQLTILSDPKRKLDRSERDCVFSEFEGVYFTDRIADVLVPNHHHKKESAGSPERLKSQSTSQLEYWSQNTYPLIQKRYPAGHPKRRIFDDIHGRVRGRLRSQSPSEGIVKTEERNILEKTSILLPWSTVTHIAANILLIASFVLVFTYFVRRHAIHNKIAKAAEFIPKEFPPNGAQSVFSGHARI